MENLSVSQILNAYHFFDKSFWVSYKALEALMEPEKFLEVKFAMLKSKKMPQNIFELVNQSDYELKCNEIDAEWTRKNEEAKAMGIKVHDAIRNAFVTDIFRARDDFQVQGDVVPADKFLSSQNGLFPEQKMEFQLDPEYNLVGIADLISIHNGVVDILDWKNDEDGIKFKSTFDVGKKRTKRMKFPLSKFDDCSGIRYQFQLSIYMWMLLKLRPDLKPGKLKLVWIKDYKAKKVFEVEYLEKEVDTLLKWHLKSIKLKKETDKCKEIKY